MRCLSIVARMRHLALAASVAGIALDAAGAQDVPTVFQHGILSDGNTWSAYMAPELRRMLKIAPVQPTLNWWRGYNEQANALANYVNVNQPAASVATLPFAAHSGGGIVSREYSRLPGTKISGLATIASPHAGAQISASWLSGAIFNYGRDAGAVVADPIIFYDQNDWELLPWWIYRYGGIIANWLYNLAAWMCPTAGLCIEAATGAVVPMAIEVAPGSGYLQGLNAQDNLNREAAQMPPRFGMYTGFQPWNTVFYLMSQNPRNWIFAKEFLIILYQEAYQYYSDHEDWWLQANAYRWLDGEVVMIDFDAVWQLFIGALIRYDRIFDPYTGFYARRMEIYRNDGFIANYAQEYPQGNNRLVAGNLAHTHHTRSAAVRDQFRDIMRNNFGIPDRPPGSTASVTVSPGSATVSVGLTRQLNAYAYDVNGALLSKSFTWTSDNPGIASVSSTGVVTGNAEGATWIRANSEGYTGSSSVSVTNLPPLSASISGPSNVRSGATCAWWAYASGGQYPYSYSWRTGSKPLESTTDELIYRNTGSGFVLSVTVRDAGGQSVTATRNVTVSTSAPICLY